NNTSPIDHNVLFSMLPYVVWPIFKVMIVVKVADGSNNDVGKSRTLPITIWTASASPNALAIPKTTAVRSDGNAAGIKTRLIVCHRVAPNAYDPSRKSFGNSPIASVAMVVMVGKIMTDKTIVPANKLNPAGEASNTFRTAGTKTVRPIKP